MQFIEQIIGSNTL